MARSDLEVPADPRRARRAIREDLAGPDPDPADRVATGREDRAAQVAPDPAVPVVPADQVAPDPTNPAVPVVPVDRVAPAPTDPADRVALPHGMGTPSAATSTAPHGVTDPHPGVLASRRRQHGTGRFRRRVERGTKARSITGATRKPPSGIRSSTNGASISSEYGFRCKQSPHTTPASPIGEAGVVPLSVTGKTSRNWIVSLPTCDNAT